MEAFGGSPGAQKGLIDALLKDPLQVRSSGRPTDAERKKTKENTSESINAALLISGANKNRFGKLKDELANNYLLGSDQYPGTYKKAVRILDNYQVTRYSRSEGMQMRVNWHS